MSFQDKLASIMARPGQDPVAKDDVPWWMKYLGRGVGTVGSVIAILLGVWNCVGILIGNVSSLISGMWQVVAAFMVICCEAPCCCMFVDHVQKFSDWVERRPYWNRALGYVILSIPPIILSPGLSTIFGSGLIFTTGVIYGMMALGRKQDMAAAASPQMATSPTGLGGQSDHHTTLMEDPDVWRPT
ncbi:calcium channel flower isoform X3 [Tribolium castaneum]|uniref:calcium channel flower isoform X3 n=1 Tax=Tribolium castaneum TaxID=7070 RepID=UPI00046BF37B|nr:PREDICTED: calcium channel flower isoform X3 [Tribolium castaneum]|eukprot:XP_008193023.1 PREDICTED: calcium channel flower isoform X3 [Tribolium castaneum]